MASLTIAERLKLLSRADNLDLVDIVCADAIAHIERLETEAGNDRRSEAPQTVAGNNERSVDGCRTDSAQATGFRDIIRDNLHDPKGVISEPKGNIEMAGRRPRKLLPCPFCGIEPVTNESSFAASISCSNENCPATLVIASGDLPSAAKKWNCRMKSAPEDSSSLPSGESDHAVTHGLAGAGTDPLGPRCPTCNLSWELFPPVKIDGEPNVRCVECKDVFDRPDLAKLQCGSKLACDVGVHECECEKNAAPAVSILGEDRA